MTSPVRRLAVIFAVLLTIPGYAPATTSYSGSAHGNASFGVSRLPPPYATGNCAHCHEQHGSIDGVEPFPTSDGTATPSALFTVSYTSETDNFCIKCHDATTEVATAVINNHSYSYRAGGLSTDYAESISEIFDSAAPGIASTHNLDDMATLLSSPGVGVLWGYDSTTQPCLGCHNPHAAQGDPANAAFARKSSSNRGFPLSRPSQHGTLSSWELWGAAATEKMSSYAASGTYQAPLYYNSTSSHEPENNAIDDGSNMTDINTFCTDCHTMTTTIYSTALNRNLLKFDWAVEMHGKGPAVNLPSKTECQPPYLDTMQGSYILACTDCHEAHGSPNIFLIRPSVNGGAVSIPAGTTDWAGLCSRCHSATSDLRAFHHQANAGYICTDCHIDDNDKAAGINNCTNCHFHGSYNATYRLF